MTDSLKQIIAKNRSGMSVSLPSICCAQPDVIAASIRLADQLDRTLLIEATSNQVNQFGGYTGMKPNNFIEYVSRIARNLKSDPDHIIFGGDHLGTQAWKRETSDVAMTKAKDLVAEYVKAGFTKIHLDCSEGCKDEPAHLSDEVIAERAAILAYTCEQSTDSPDLISYIVGTEVPVPGGARAGDGHEITPTTPVAARNTIDEHFSAFKKKGLEQSIERIVGLVVQPGVEFGPLDIDYLQKQQDGELKVVLKDYEGLVYEAHSTDYQKPDAYPRLADMGFAIQKVGPALTFAYREALYSLEILLDLIGISDRKIPKIRDVLEAEMVKDSRYWIDHYHGDPDSLSLQRHFSYSDRIRYYWSRPNVQSSIAALYEQLSDLNIPDPLLSQVFGKETIENAEILRSEMSLCQAFVQSRIQVELKPYYFHSNHSVAR